MKRVQQTTHRDANIDTMRDIWRQAHIWFRRGGSGCVAPDKLCTSSAISSPKKITKIGNVLSYCLGIPLTSVVCFATSYLKLDAGLILRHIRRTVKMC